jgi:hypothetical protein
MNFDTLWRCVELRILASQVFKYVGQQKMKNSGMPLAEFEPVIPVSERFEAVCD